MFQVCYLRYPRPHSLPPLRSEVSTQWHILVSWTEGKCVNLSTPPYKISVEHSLEPNSLLGAKGNASDMSHGDRDPASGNLQSSRGDGQSSYGHKMISNYKIECLKCV